VTRQQYIACENIDFFNQFNKFDVAEVKACGFKDMESFRFATIRCHIYNLIKACRKEKLGVVLAAYGTSQLPAIRLDLTFGIESVSLSLHHVHHSVLDVMHDVSVDKLLDIGWTFWSIPLGTF